MRKTTWSQKAFLLLCLCGLACCKENPENLPEHDSVFSTSNMIMPVHNRGAVENDLAPDAVVFVCKSAGARRYHLSRECHGLKRCRHAVEESSKEVAENTGFTMCGFENEN